VRRIAVLPACVLVLLVLLVPAAVAEADAEQEAIEELNQIRRSHGLSALRSSDSLHRSASSYAREMIRRDFFGHGSRIDVAGQFRSAGETLAMHSGWSAQPRATVSRWMNSPPHRAVLLSSRYHWVGMGLAHGRLGSRAATTWVAHVGSR
jgi:uncharacterized protein YkwD